MLKISFFWLSLSLLIACQNSNNELADNQFRYSDGILTFNNELIVHWSEAVLPSCILCNLTKYVKHSPAGPIRFQKIADQQEKLIFLNIKNAHLSFALITGTKQYSIKLKIVNKQLFMSLEQMPFLALSKHKAVNLKIGNAHYLAKLNHLTLADEKVEGKASEQALYKADISIWLNNTHP